MILKNATAMSSRGMGQSLETINFICNPKITGKGESLDTAC